MSIKRVELRDGTTRYRFVVDNGRDPVTGKRKQLTRTFDTQAEAEAEHARHVAASMRSVSIRYRRAIADVLAEDLGTFVLPHDTSDGVAYAVLARPYLKLGFSGNPRRRLTELRTKTQLVVPDDLDRSSAHLWLEFAGGKDAEVALQWLARNYHVVGEWYWAEEPLIEALDHLAGAFEAARGVA